jgi:thioredoxin 1
MNDGCKVGCGSGCENECRTRKDKGYGSELLRHATRGRQTRRSIKNDNMKNPRKAIQPLEDAMPPNCSKEASMTEINPRVHVNDETFAETVINSDLPVLVDFWAPWCGPCRAIASTIEELAREYAGRIKFVKVNVDEGQRTAMSLGVMNIPTLILFANGKQINRQVGVQPKAILNDIINQWLFEHPSWAPA